MTPGHVLLACLVAVCWGVAFVATRIGLDSFTPPQLAALRFLVAALPAVVVARPPLPWRSLAAVGLALFAGQFLFQFFGIALGMPAGLAAIVVHTQALFTVAFAALALGERPTRRQLVGMLLAAAGLLAIATTAGADLTVIGLALSLLSAVSWAIGNILVKQLPRVEMLEPRRVAEPRAPAGRPAAVDRAGRADGAGRGNGGGVVAELGGGGLPRAGRDRPGLRGVELSPAHAIPRRRSRRSRSSCPSSPRAPPRWCWASASGPAASPAWRSCWPGSGSSPGRAAGRAGASDYRACGRSQRRQATSATGARTTGTSSTCSTCATDCSKRTRSGPSACDKP